MPRALDHFVMPVASLGMARARFQALGFTVAPDARHPFGTENCCIFFEDGTFIEPLAIGDDAAYRAALADGNRFVGNDAALRGVTGFSQLVLQSTDAMADHAAWQAAGVSGGDVLDFGRSFTRPDGTTGQVAFRLAFAALAQTQAALFACQVVKALPGGRGALVSHANGAKAARTIIAAADNPADAARMLAPLLNADVTSSGGAAQLQLANGTVIIMTPNDASQACGHTVPPGPLRWTGLVLDVPDLAIAARILEGADVNCARRNGSIIVPPTAGQGAALIFQVSS